MREVRIRDTLSGELRAIEADADGVVGIYACGPTVYSRIHIGNARPFVVFSLLARFLESEGYAARLVVNVTDVNDKIYTAARAAGVPSAEFARQMTAAYFEDTSRLGLGRPDAEPLATFVGDTLRAQDGEAPDHHLADWTRDLLEGRHPSFTPADATVVTDSRTGEIVSCLHLLSQTWSYGGVPISVGQPELIGTRTARRGHGLVRAQFEVHHRWAAERGHQLLAIAGIPWFYRQFGYEFAIERGGGPRLHTDQLQHLYPVFCPQPAACLGNDPRVWVVVSGDTRDPYADVPPAQAALLQANYRISYRKKVPSLTVFLLVRT